MSVERSEFIAGYVMAAAFTEQPDEWHTAGDFSAIYDDSMFTTAARAELESQAGAFFDQHAATLAGYVADIWRHHEIGPDDYEQAGNMFWYNRNGHGTGFWEFDSGHAEQLEQLSSEAGEVYVTFNGQALELM